ncbi:unnamed protein product [marine sediment metagenome]|uniref:Uncharacterized protein n=1 Tax=marine sediment metagenome TaxID=412755 RepID=X1FTK7_9ZZZZ
MKREIEREQIGKSYIYLLPGKKVAQLTRRKERLLQETDIYNECLQLFLSGLNEKQLRIYAGLESLGLGYGGETTVSRRLGIDVKTVAKGREELLSKNVNFARIRNIGAGRPSLKKTKKF